MQKLPKKLLVFLFILTILAVGVFFLRDKVVRWFFSPTDSNLPVGIENSTQVDSQSETIETLAENLSVPWDIVRLPDNDLLITERSGRISRVGQVNESYDVADVRETAEGGLLGMALDPDFEDNNYLYVYMTTSGTSGIENQVVRYRYADNTLRDRVIVLGGLPGANTHNGGKIAFGPDGLLYITTGDVNIPETAQDTRSLAGKILRIAKDGSIPADNPFNNAVYSYGHRNAQGIAWDSEGRLWSTEHGRSGAQSGFDELNLIKKGGNYGWPVIQGDESREGMLRPVAHSGPNETWAPGGIAYADGELYFNGLRGRRLYQATIKTDESVVLKTHFISEFGRLRAATTIDNFLLIGTSNRDGRGQPADNDDRIIRIPLSIFK